MSFASQKFKSYIGSKYDVKFIFTPSDMCGNILTRLQNALASMINQTIRLPRFIIILLDCDFMKITGDYESTKGTVRWLMSSIIQAIGKRKKWLEDFAFRETEPKFLFMKPTPKPKRLDDCGSGRFQCRIYNRSVESIICRYDNFYTYNANEIKPEKNKFFEEGSSRLSFLGHKVYWCAIEEAVRKIDHNRLLTMKEIQEEIDRQKRARRHEKK